MTAPLTKAPLADAFGRALLMSLASVNFLAAAIIWLRMPETSAGKSSQNDQLIHTTPRHLSFVMNFLCTVKCMYIPRHMASGAA